MVDLDGMVSRDAEVSHLGASYTIGNRSFRDWSNPSFPFAKWWFGSKESDVGGLSKNEGHLCRIPVVALGFPVSNLRDVARARRLSLACAAIGRLLEPTLCTLNGFR